MGAVGYAYTRAEVVDLGSEYAVHLGIKTKDDKQLSLRWFYSFMGRWPELKIWRPKTISELRAKATSRASIYRYFDELNRIMEKYQLKDKPQSIYNVDEKGLQPNYKPPTVVASAEYVPSTLSSEKGQTTTVMGCGNALGHQIPPYFIFAGKRMRQELLEGATPGADGSVSETGWSNSEIFQSYLENHFIKYITGMQDKHILLLYDGHRTHITPDIIDWAVEKKIILYVLPPHTSHVLQPMDVGCFGPFARIYSSECHKFQRTHSAVINKYNLCSIACKSYNSALSPSNLQSAFRKSGIYPLDRDAIDQSLFSISDAIHRQSQSDENIKVDDIPAIENETTEPVNLMSDSEINADTEPILSNQENENIQIYVAEKITDEKPDENTTFFTAKSTNLSKKNPPKQERRSIYKIVAGKAITEPETRQEIKEYIAQSKSRTKSKTNNKSTKHNINQNAKKTTTKRKQNGSSSSSSSTTTNKKLKQNQQDSQQPGPSGLQKIVVSDGSITDEDDQDDDNTLCCVCNMWQPKELQDCISIVFNNGPNVNFYNVIIGLILNFAVMSPSYAGQINFTAHVMALPCKQKETEE
ncbi:unnamed protein product [Mytilus coruscus]|uniref:DDE-1 domain-containing protein n=1 Tax=Mytilus coruscus TaxID=42192 RepID=A0A6J8CQ47_MYTCO|nr:unnamed protein product [Mytilus coruscus]